MIGSLLFHWCRTRSHQVKSAGSANVTRLRPNKRSNRALPGFGPGLTGFDGFCRVFHRFEWLKLCWMPTRFSLVGKKRVSFFVPRAGLIVFCFCLARRHLRYRANNENSKKKRTTRPDNAVTGSKRTSKHCGGQKKIMKLISRKWFICFH